MANVYILCGNSGIWFVCRFIEINGNDLVNFQGVNLVGITKERALEALRGIKDPATGDDIVSAGIVRGMNVDSGIVRFVLEINPAMAKEYEPVRVNAEFALNGVSGVKEVHAVLTAHETKAPPDLGKRPKPSSRHPEKIPGVARVLALASGKGGVGKSTVSANLACALVAEGRRVGLLDADVYGPSQQRMLGVSERPSSPDGKAIIPVRNHGVTMMSIGLMIEEGRAVIWRGPMLMQALQQMLRQVQWGSLDCLIVDLPPGTGDVQMTLAQRTVVDGAIIVSTPQDVALIDARKGVDMFKKLNVPVLGMIENMSTHICSNCGHEEHIFGHGGVAEEAEKLGVPLLAEVPLHLDIRIAADHGTPLVAASPHSAHARVFRDVAKKLMVNGHA